MKYTKKIVLAGLLLALALLLPFLTGQIPQIGSKLSPMHIPVLIAGFVCGWPYAVLIGAVAPSLRYLLFSMPPIFPVGLAMSFELAAYGFIAGMLYKKLKKTNINVYITLICAMLGGRIVWGTAMFIISRLSMVKFSLKIFLTGAFINAVPGIILHIILIPIIIIALKKAGLIENDEFKATSVK